MCCKINFSVTQKTQKKEQQQKEWCKKTTQIAYKRKKMTNKIRITNIVCIIRT